MSLQERTGARDLLYSSWHRPAQIKRFLGTRRAALLKVIDIDWCEACQWCSEPLCLIETQRSKSEPKSATITVKLAQAACLEAVSVSFIPTEDGTDIEGFRWKRLWPLPSVQQRMTPQEYAEWLWSLRVRHEHNCERVVA